MVKHLQIYRGENEPEDRNSFMWLHTKDGKRVLEEYNGSSWAPVSADSAEIQAEIGDLSELTTDEKSSLVAAINEVAEGGSQGGGMVSITYSELKALRDAGSLIPGQQYRITDYHCTTTQENTQSADHQFDIIVTADDEKTLNENARAANRGVITVGAMELTPIDSPREDKYLYIRYIPADRQNKFAWVYCNEAQDIETLLRINSYSIDSNYIVLTDTPTPTIGEIYEDVDGQYTCTRYSEVQMQDYFIYLNLSSWELKYSIDNDKSKFEWAQPEKLVINDGEEDRTLLRIDKIKVIYNGEVYNGWSPSILAYRPIDCFFTKGPITGDTVMLYLYDGENIIEGAEAPIVSVDQGGTGVIYYMCDELNNSCPYDFKNIQFKRKLTDGRYDPSEGEEFYVYTFSALNQESEDYPDYRDASVVSLIITGEDRIARLYCKDNTIKGYSSTYEYETNSLRLNNIVFLGSYSDGSDYTACYSNSFDTGCFNNTFECSCYNNTFGKRCNGIVFGSGCYANILSDFCERNTFGGNCTDNILISSFSNKFDYRVQNKHIVSTVGTENTISGTTKEFWFNGTKKW